jgi:YgiT-type zinc finger domain-containing protein
MKCSILGCPGQYRPRLIVHTVKRGDKILVFENVPAEACDVCSDLLLAPNTVRHLEEMMRRDEKPEKQAPVYAYT